MLIRFVKIHKDAVKPTKGHRTDACYDLYSVEEDFYLKPRERTLIKIGLIIEIPEGFEGQIRPRSGNANTKGLMVVNSPGTIDSGYRGEIRVILYNSDDMGHRISKGSKIAQLAIKKVYDFKFIEVEIDDLDKSDRGEGGFGSTGS